MHQPPPTIRLARAVVFGLLCVTTTALGHSLAVGSSLSLRTLVVSTAVTAAACWHLAARQRSLPTVLGATVAAQGLLHTFFMTSQVQAQIVARADRMDLHHMQPATGTTMPSMPSMMTMADGTGGRLAMASGAHGMSLAMAVAHLVAAVICGLWLWRGETATFRLLGALSTLLFAPLARAGRILTRQPGTGPVDTAVQVDATVGLPDHVILRHDLVRRGPPRVPAFF